MITKEVKEDYEVVLNFFPRVLSPSALGALSRTVDSVVCFTDGSAGVPAGRGGVGIVLRFGKFTIEIGQPIRSPVNSYLAELMAIQLACDLFPANKKLFIKTDCLNLVNMLNGSSAPKKIPKLIQRVKQKVIAHNAEVLFLPKPSRVGAHSRADRLASKSRIEGRSFFRIVSVE